MLNRRSFSTLATCAICAVTGFVATEAAAQSAPPAGQGASAQGAPGQGVKRKILSETEGPAPGYVTLLVEAEIDAGVAVGRHTHPGIESTYVLEGEIELPIEGKPTRTVKAGDTFQVPAGTPHAGGKPAGAKTRLMITYVVEKGKPLATPA